MNHFWREKGWRWVTGNQNTKRKEALSSHIYFYFIWFEPFQEQKFLYFTNISFPLWSAATRYPKFTKGQAAAGWPCVHGCFEVFVPSCCWQGDAEAHKGQNVRWEGLLAHTPLNPQQRPEQCPLSLGRNLSPAPECRHPCTHRVFHSTLIFQCFCHTGVENYVLVWMYEFRVCNWYYRFYCCPSLIRQHSLICPLKNELKCNIHLSDPSPHSGYPAS